MVSVTELGYLGLHSWFSSLVRTKSNLILPLKTSFIIQELFNSGKRILHLNIKYVIWMGNQHDMVQIVITTVFFFYVTI